MLIEIILAGFPDPINVQPVCLRIPEGNYDASGIMQVINKELIQAWTAVANASGGVITSMSYPQLFINASNQKAYFAFYPKSPDTSNYNLSFRWFDKIRCGCCNDCCNRDKAIRSAETEAGMSWPPTSPFYFI